MKLLEINPRGVKGLSSRTPTILGGNVALENPWSSESQDWKCLFPTACRPRLPKRRKSWYKMPRDLNF